MSKRVVACTSVAELLDACIAEACGMLPSCQVVNVLVDATSWELAIKKRLASKCVVGVNVATVDHWLESQWELWGDGTKLANAQQRHLLARPVLAQLAGLSPSRKYVTQFTSFVEDVLATGQFPGNDELAGAVRVYEASLAERGLASRSDAMRRAFEHAAGQGFVFACPDDVHPRSVRLVEGLAAEANVLVLGRELPCAHAGADANADEVGELVALRSMLFSGSEGLTPTGKFSATEIHGVHAEGAVIARLVKELAGGGKCYGRIAVVFPSASSIPPSLPFELDEAGIPVECRLSVPLRQTAFGSAYLQLERLLADEDDGAFNSIALACSDYLGLDRKTARGFAAVWRAQAGSSHEERLKALAVGLRGRVPTRAWNEKLERVRKLIEASGSEQRVRLMFENARSMRFDVNRLADDAAVANAILDYLALCEELGCPVALEDIADLNVSLVRDSDCEDERVSIVGEGELSLLEGVERVVFARLDKASYAMAQPPSPFDRYLAELGYDMKPDTPRRQRTVLLDAIEKGCEGFACYRLATNAEGDDNCQSALWDELMNVYRSPADGEAPVHTLPRSLVAGGCGRRVCEADLFVDDGRDVAASSAVDRGALDAGAFDLLFPDFENFNETFSPTALEDYYRCPYRWFVCRRIGANSLDKPFDQIAKGNLAHAVLERFYLDMEQAQVERVTFDNLESCLEMANSAFDWQLDHEIERHRLNLMSDRDWQEVQVVRKQVLDLVRRDAAFLPGFAPRFLELKLEDPDGKPLVYAGVPIRGKVDRIDVDGQGRAVVIDYKLSGLASGYGLTSEPGLPSRIQTDIYALLVQRCLRMQGVEVEVVGSVYRSYAKNMLRGVYAEGIDWGSVERTRSQYDALPGGSHLETYPEYLEQVEKTVEELVARMREGDIAARPLCKDACEYCLAQSFCEERRRA